jgi:hypothetical protein
MKRTTKMRRLALDSLILITTEEKLISIEHAKTSELIGIKMAITDETLDRERRVGASAPFGKILAGLHTSHDIFEK